MIQATTKRASQPISRAVADAAAQLADEEEVLAGPNPLRGRTYGSRPTPLRVGTGEFAMKCPVCTAPDLVMSEKQGIEIDYCPKCRGIWLDRGELDKLIEKAARDDGSDAPSRPAAPAQTQTQPYAQPYQQPHAHPHASGTYRPELDDSKAGYQYKRKKAWWTEIFD
jgi:hypothetical protein